ncbi:MAG: hypothetical protein ACREBV_04255 [Candidatus Zixiibacteriota bacterium]
MFKMYLGLFLLFGVLLIPASLLADSGGRIYGTILTTDGETFEGLIRWDKNEVSWIDVLNGNKELADKNRRQSKKNYRKSHNSSGGLEIFGLKIGGESFGWPDNAQSGIRFGHIKSLEAIDNDAVLLALKSGLEIELSGGSTDIGQDLRELIIEDESKGEIELVWDDIDRVEFSAAKAEVASGLGERLYGTLTTRRGDEYTGFVCWDVDEVLTADELDGDERDRSRKIEFSQISAIERYSSSGATVIMKSGDERILKGTNDVDDSNRGIIISDPGFGQVQVGWDEFNKLEFKPSGKPVTYRQFDGGRKLKGTVHTEDGDSFSGEIRWDNDEEYTWEILDGEFGGAEFDIEFGLIKSIEKSSSRASIITILDGRTFRLRGSNDVDADNKGIFISSATDDVEEITWDDFSKVEFSN